MNGALRDSNRDYWYGTAPLVPFAFDIGAQWGPWQSAQEEADTIELDRRVAYCHYQKWRWGHEIGILNLPGQWRPDESRDLRAS